MKSQLCSVVFSVVLFRTWGLKILSSAQKCPEVPQDVLEKALGTTFNPRFMSISAPAAEGRSGKRSDAPAASFYVEQDYRRELDEEPAWPWTSRRRRSAKLPWKCQSEMAWTDLGPDYFPRFIRSVECAPKSCWYGLFKCKSRQVAIKLLRRKKGKCMVVETGTALGFEGLPLELRELWVWEERALGVCCECAMD